MIRPVMTLAIVCLFGLVFAAMYVNNEVARVRDDIRTLRAQVIKDRKDIHVLEAEWTYLNQPTRISAMAEHFLEMVPVTSEKIIDIEQIPMRNVVLKQEKEPSVLSPYAVSQR